MNSDEEIMKTLRPYRFREPFYTEEVANFLKERKHFMETGTGRLDMAYWYDIIYTSLKGEWVEGNISEADFRYLTDFVGEL